MYTQFFTDKIHKYWSRTDLGMAMLDSEYVSDSELLFLIPNNVKKRYGLPMTRTCRRKNKRKYKSQRRRFILSFRLFDIIEDIVDKKICEGWQNNEFFQSFVDVSNVAGQANTYEVADISQDNIQIYRLNYLTEGHQMIVNKIDRYKKGC